MGRQGVLSATSTASSHLQTSSHCLKTLKAFEKERDLRWLSGEGAALAQGGWVGQAHYFPKCPAHVNQTHKDSSWS